MLHQTTRTRFFRQRTIWALLLIVALLLSAASVAVAVTPPAEPDAPAAPDAAPFLWTDKADYQPEEIVHAGGANFLPGAYAVPVLRPDGTIVKGDGSFAPGYDLALVPPGSLTFTYDYTLDGIVGRYELRAYAEGVPVPANAAEWAADLNYVASVSFTGRGEPQNYQGSVPRHLHGGRADDQLQLRPPEQWHDDPERSIRRL